MNRSKSSSATKLECCVAVIPAWKNAGIGVGYPGGVNLAFDAEQMRLATLWKGQFVDPSGVWYGQGHGKVRPMGKTIPFGKVLSWIAIETPWIVDDGRPPNHHFQGYVLDKQRRPNFQYTLHDIQVEDFFREFTDEKTQQMQLRRRIKLVAGESASTLRFRLSEGQDVNISADGKRVTNDRLRIRIVSSQTAEIRDHAEGKQAFIPLELGSWRCSRIGLGISMGVTYVRRTDIHFRYHDLATDRNVRSTTSLNHTR